ncbi:hypothetical protein DFH07DRAFT_958443 [Mycena maculata]|uniref:F-box domain-containing protein n=1 Tax=Mycena maculata TaxID=230809 RepID=A0AAD7J7Y2_9AGAR|nr:hypothetical protein DFH07DRAFT_958443 [Mycena maculata]
MIRETTVTDWARFVVHSRRVRKFTFVELDNHYLAPWNTKTKTFEQATILHHIQEQFPLSNIFPNLLTLSWGNLLDNIDMFICPHLRNLHLRSSTLVPRVLEVLDSHSPTITSVDLNTSFYHDVPDDVANAVSLAMPRVERLVLFRCGLSIRSKALIHLSAVSGLRHLEMSLESADDSPFPSATPATFFPDITNFVVHPSESTLLGPFLNTVTSRHLKEIRCEVIDTDPKSILDVLAVLAHPSHPSRDALNSLSISGYYKLVEDDVPTCGECVRGDGGAVGGRNVGTT